MLDLKSVVCIPLVTQDEVMGALYVDSRRAIDADGGKAWMLRVLAAQAAVSTARLRHEAALVAAESRARAMVHDLRNLVHTAKIELEMLAIDDAMPQELVASTQAVGDCMSALIEHSTALLQNKEPERAEVDLVVVSGDVIKLLAPDSRRRGVEVFLTSEPAKVVGDALDLSRALMNLLNNALRYSARGDKIEVSIQRDGAMALWSVRDHGPGIPEDRLPDVLAEGVRDDTGGGFGLGLAIVQRFAREHGGALAIENHPDGGAYAEILLPAV